MDDSANAAPLLLFQKDVDDLGELFVRLRADEALPIDEKCGRAGHALVLPGFGFRAHFGEILVAVEARAELGLVESQLGGETFQIRFRVRAAIFAALSGKQ